MDNQEKNIKHICKRIKNGDVYPVNLYVYKITCGCKDTELRVSEGTPREKLEKEFDICSICNKEYKISEGLIHNDSATLIILSQADSRIPVIILASVSPKHIEQIDLAGKDLINKRPNLVPLIQEKLNNLMKKNDGRNTY